jgi:hypothetical protein
MANLKALQQLIELERQRDALNQEIKAKIEEVQAMIDNNEAELDLPLNEKYVIQNPKLWNKKESGSFHEVKTARIHSILKSKNPKWDTEKKECRQSRLSFISSVVGRTITSTKELTVAELETLLFLLEVKHGK